MGKDVLIQKLVQTGDGDAQRGGGFRLRCTISLRWRFGFVMWRDQKYLKCL